ncbi:MAG TPA: rhomboid family intramembrane serine protease [Geobacterales bacterium]|nr:rhomboid family intramembrane serine protease [Geobacterales bacterium]
MSFTKASLTNIIIIINVVVFLLTVITANFFYVTVEFEDATIEYKASSVDVLLGSGTIYRAGLNTYVIPISGLQFYLSQENYFVINHYFYWQLFTSMFVHFGILHLTFNMLALYFFGSAVEYSYGRKRFLVIYLLSGLLGNVASLFLLQYLPFSGGGASDIIPSAGASGAIFGLLGAFAIVGRLSGRLASAILYVIVIFLINSFIPGVNIFAHLFGLIGGLLVGYIFVKHAMRKRYEQATFEI